MMSVLYLGTVAAMAYELSRDVLRASQLVGELQVSEAGLRESAVALEVSHREIQHLAGRLIEAQDAERARVARDLHDDVSQQLAGMSIAFSGLRQRMGESEVSDDLQEDLRVLQQRTSTLAKNVRHLSHDLHPTVLRHAGLVAALTAYCTELTRTHGTELTCRAEGDFASIAPEPALCLYRVAQEALRNVIAHAGASRADVRLVRTDDIAEMTVTDDGRGFDVAGSFERGKGLGLVSITERVRLAGGTVTIVPDVNRGRACVSGFRQAHERGATLAPAVQAPGVSIVSRNHHTRPDTERERCAEPPSSSPTTTRSSPKVSPGSLRSMTSMS